MSTRDLHNAPGDDASSGTNTACDAIMCDVNHHVQNHTCVACRSGKYNSEKHDASSGDTECEWITCDENEYVNNYQCLPCHPGLIMLHKIIKEKQNIMDCVVWQMRERWLRRNTHENNNAPESRGGT